MTTDLTDAVVQAAAQLAAGGDHAAALALLEQLEEDDGSRHTPGAVSHREALPVLLLKAKVLAQMQRYDEAIAAWEQVLETEPDNAEAQDGIELAEKAKRGIGRFLYRYPWPVYAGAASLLLIGAFVVWAGSRPARPGWRQIEALNSRLDQLDAALVPLLATPAAGKTAAPAQGPDLDAVRRQIADLDGRLQSQTGEIQKELAQVRGQLAKATQSEAAPAASRRQSDELSARIAAMETQIGEDRAALSRETTAFRQRLDRLRLELFRARAADLLSRNPPAARDLDAIQDLASRIREEGLETPWQEFATKLVQYADQQRRVGPK